MIPIPELNAWTDTKDALHHATQQIGLFRKAVTPSLPNALHLPLFVREFGLSTGVLPFGTLELHIAQAQVRYLTGQHAQEIGLAGMSPSALRADLIALLREAGHDLTDAIAEAEDDTPFTFDFAACDAYREALWRVAMVMMQLRADWFGAVTPLVVWPHGFDLSQLFFPNNTPDEHTEPHLNFGFSPGSAGLPRPYVYAYAHPMPDGLVGAPLPSLARWHTQGWTGVVIDYDQLVTRDFPDTDLLDALRGVFHTLVTGLARRGG